MLVTLLIELVFMFVIGFLTASLIFRRRIKLLYKEQQIIEEQHKREFQDLISRVHHEGQVPIARSALGLANLISLALEKCINLLKEFQPMNEYKLSGVIEELIGIRHVEIVFIQNKLNELLATINKELKKYEHKNSD